MNIKKLLIIYILLFFKISASECPDDFIVINNNCFYQPHINVLQDFIDNNMSLYHFSASELGYQKWSNNKLVELYLGNLQINVIPKNIGILKDLNFLDLSNNNIKSVPIEICDIYPYYTHIDLSKNQICPPYPFCYDYISNQKNIECTNFKCDNDYININNKCYYKKHIDILQELIDLNSSLNEIDPLEIGSEIGYQEWKNGKLIQLNLINNNLVSLPESICYLYSNLDYFNVSKNSICPPYPSCFEFIGFQNISDCEDLPRLQSIINNVDDTIANLSFKINLLSPDVSNTPRLWQSSCPYEYVKYDNNCYFQPHINILQDFIDNNIILGNIEPLELGFQEWSNNKLVNLDLGNLGINIIPDSISVLKNIISLDLSNNNLESLSEEICSIYPSYVNINLENNQICPPYPRCFDYVGKQRRELCRDSVCPKNYTQMNNDCIFTNHLKFLSSIVDSNAFLKDTFLNIELSEFYDKIGYQKWDNGKLDSLIIQNSYLTKIPESFCTIYKDLSFFNIDNNLVCPPYPSCIKNFNNQILDDCEMTNLPQLNCPKGSVSYYNSCYNVDDLTFLNDLIKINSTLINYHPLSIGFQSWKNNRLTELSLEGLNLENIPKSIFKLSEIKKINFSNNNIASIPENFCLLYSQLESFEINNNNICSPYTECFDFIGKQKKGACEPNQSFCSFGYIEIDGNCYYEKDVEILNQFILQNKSLKDIKALDIGIQKWKNMQLESLYLGKYQLTSVPENICLIMPRLKTFNISQNNICSEYPACIEGYVKEQNTANCN